MCSALQDDRLCSSQQTDTISVRCNFELPLRNGRSRTRFARSWPRRRSSARTSRAGSTTGWSSCASGRRLLRGRLRRPRVAERVRRRRPPDRRADRRRPGARRGRRAGVRRRRRPRRARPVAARASATTSSDAATSRRSCRPRRSGARASPSRRPGSDLASLRTRAVETRRPLRAQRPEDLGLLGPVRALVRRARPHRARRGPKHSGISMLIVDMRLAGRRACGRWTQITGHAEFCELFLDDVVVPKENLLGAPRRRLEDRDAHARPRARDRRAAAPGDAADLARPRSSQRRGARAGALDDPRVQVAARAGADRASRCCATTRTARSAVPQRRRGRPGELRA